MRTVRKRYIELHRCGDRSGVGVKPATSDVKPHNDVSRIGGAGSGRIRFCRLISGRWPGKPNVCELRNIRRTSGWLVRTLIERPCGDRLLHRLLVHRIHRAGRAGTRIGKVDDAEIAHVEQTIGKDLGGAGKSTTAATATATTACVHLAPVVEQEVLAVRLACNVQRLVEDDDIAD